MTIQYKSFVLLGLLTIIAQTLTAQTYCMKYDVVKNNNTVDVTLSLIASGSTFKLGSGNLQFKYKAAALSTPTLVSEVLSNTHNYNGITVTEPTSLSLEGTGDALVSFNYNFVGGTGNGFPISTSTAGIPIAVIRFQTLDGTLSPNIRPYDNGSMGTVVFDDNTLNPALLLTTGNCSVYDIALSVEWLYIKAYPTPLSENKTISVDWATALEKDNSHFVVERSLDGQTFLPIGIVKAANKASTYHFIDEKPFKMLNYYRIRQLDLKGTESLSKIDSVWLKSSSKLSIYPSPTQGILSIETDDTSTYTVINAQGQQVLSGPITKQLDVSDFAAGTYFLKVGAEQVKFVKQ